MKLLTEFDGHPKVLTAGLSGAGLYARALAYCGKYETDGVIPEAWVEQAVAHEGLPGLPARLVEIGLWHRNESGYEIADFESFRGGSLREPISVFLRRQVIGRDGHICQICGEPVEPTDIHIDHIKPVAHGGTSDIDNLQVSHSRCNLSKGARVAT